MEQDLRDSGVDGALLSLALLSLLHGVLGTASNVDLEFIVAFLKLCLFWVLSSP